MLNSTLQNFEALDPELVVAAVAESKRQEDHIELIASENYASPLVMAMQGSQLTNKYAEGYPGARYYGGCEHVDVIESLAIERAKQLFNARFANVQPHSGSQANAAVFMALMKPGDTVLGMSLADGGHLTHGAHVNFSGRIYQSVQYGLNQLGSIDYERILHLAKKHRPKVIIAGFSAYSGILDWKKFREIADEVHAYLLVDMAHVAGLVAAGVYPSPVPYADVVTTTTHKTLAGPRGGLILSNSQEDALHKKLNFSVFPELQGGPLCHVIAAKAACFKEAMSEDFARYQKQVVRNAQTMCKQLQKEGIGIVSNGTENHLFLVDLTAFSLTGKLAETVLGHTCITVNKNAVPNDSRSPQVTSGLRLGTPAITRRGFNEKEARLTAGWIAEILTHIDDEKKIQRIKHEVADLCRQFPVYASMF